MDSFTNSAEWSTKFKNDLPDSAFLYIESGGKKDGEGKTTPRSLRHFPYRDMEGKVDRAHILNAIARIPQAKFLNQKQKDRLQARARAIYLKYVKYNSKKANSFVEAMNAVAKKDETITLRDSIAYQIYRILVGLYEINPCIKRCLGDSKIWKPNFLEFLKKKASEINTTIVPFIEATVMAEGHVWFEERCPDCFMAPVIASDTTEDGIRRQMMLNREVWENPVERDPNAPEWSNDISFNMLINQIYIPAQFRDSRAKMTCLYNFFRDMVMIEPMPNQGQQRELLNLFMVWSECLSQAD